MATSEMEYEQNGERERTAANNFIVSLVGEKTVAARNDVTATKNC